jgi:uncharacterized membrane protein
MTRSLQAKLLILAVFVIGALTGGVLNQLYETRVQSSTVSEDDDSGRPDRGRRPPDFQRFEDFLDLDQDQRGQLDRILSESGERYRELQAQTRPMYRDLTEQSRSEINGILSESQRVRYEEWTERLRDVRGGGGRGDRDGRGGRDVERNRSERLDPNQE